MVRRSRRMPEIPEEDRADLLAQVKALHSRIALMAATVLINSQDYQALTGMLGYLDAMAEALTGSRTALHARFYSAPPR